VVAEVDLRIGAEYPEVARLFRQCYPNTLETTTELLDDGTTFVFTGDIPAMWLRDSSAQVRPYVLLAATHQTVRRVVAGLIRRQAMYIAIDAYANAFNREPNGRGHQRDRTTMGPWIWERKFELDSLCYPIQLCKDYWDATGDAAVFDQSVYRMLGRILEVMRAEQHHERDSRYTFRRPLPPTRRDTLTRWGRGSPVSPTGMVWSGFRPSDDACRYGFHIPANMFAVVVLGHVVEFAERIYGDPAMAGAAARLRDEIDAGIQTYGMVEHPHYGQIYAYETDGFGRSNLMDDANVPSLLSIPYLGYRPADDPTYLRTRAFVLSRANRYYAEGAYARGVGSPHTPRGYVWPIGLIVQGLTATDSVEQRRTLDMLVATTAGTGYMHESFDPNRPERFTRPWFAWANSLFGALVCRWAGVELR
jgi:uncharacterized protein